MTLHVQCPHCDQVNALTPSGAVRYAGHALECAQCGEEFVVPRTLAAERAGNAPLMGEIVRAAPRDAAEGAGGAARIDRILGAEVTAGAYPMPAATASEFFPRAPGDAALAVNAALTVKVAATGPASSNAASGTGAASAASAASSEVARGDQTIDGITPPDAAAPPALPWTQVEPTTFPAPDAEEVAEPAPAEVTLGRYGFTELLNPDDPPAAPPPPTINWLAAASAASAIFGLFIPIVPGLLAIVLGLTALGRTRWSRVGATALAAGGVLVGFLGLVLGTAVFNQRVLPALEKARDAAMGLAGAGSAGATTAGDPAGAAAGEACEAHFRAIYRGIATHRRANAGRFPDRLDELALDRAAGQDLLACAAIRSTAGLLSNASAVGTRADASTPGNADSTATADPARAADVARTYVYTAAGLAASAPAQSVLLYEPLAAHGGGAGIRVLFADGRIAQVGAAEAQQATRRLAAGTNPPWPDTAR
ncbi:MAG TPA: hypothetical protein VER17_19990 [Tepidisphaeraceae bacterium]|nr:hypothetical protein [Tepidisphaeraceae bacterium]